MTEYLLREDVLKCFDPVPVKAQGATGMRIPTASEVQFKVETLTRYRREKSEWKWCDEPVFGNPYGSYKCECGYINAHKTNFCPNCGADKRKKL